MIFVLLEKGEAMMSDKEKLELIRKIISDYTINIPPPGREYGCNDGILLAVLSVIRCGEEGE